MTWFKVDDNLAFHSKVLKAGNTAMGLWVRAGSECASQLLDGFVPDQMVALLGGHGLAKRLIAAGLWMRVEGGYLFHEWSERQPTRVEVEDERKAAKARKERWKERRRNAVPDSVPNGVQNGDGTGTHARASTRPDPTRPDPKDIEPLAPDKPTRKITRLPDPLWDALIAACGLKPDEITDPQRGATNKALSQLRAVNATADDITARAVIYRRRFPNAPLTPTGLAKQWAGCGTATEPVPAYWRKS